MQKIPFRLTSLLLTTLCLKSVYADEEIKHFPALAAPDTVTAKCNLERYNAKLKAITSKQTLSAEDMVKVHELTYTLENAVIRLQENLAQLSADLEETHLASEALKGAKVKQSGERYLQAIELILQSSSCKQ